MNGGFGPVAYPMAYRSSGIMTFVVGPDGHVYENDLGERTDELAGAMTAYDPDPTWKRRGGRRRDSLRCLGHRAGYGLPLQAICRCATLAATRVSSQAPA